MQKILFQQALAEANQDTAVIVDVREPAEYADQQIIGSINLPSSRFHAAHYDQFQDKKICLVCESSRRAKTIASRLSDAGVDNVYVLDQHFSHWAQPHRRTRPTGWSIDRQFRLVLGLLLLFSLAGYLLWTPLFLVIPAIVCAGLINAAITDRCYLKIAIARMPWNQPHSPANSPRIQRIFTDAQAKNPLKSAISRHIRGEFFSKL